MTDSLRHGESVKRRGGGNDKADRTEKTIRPFAVFWKVWYDQAVTRSGETVNGRRR